MITPFGAPMGQHGGKVFELVPPAAGKTGWTYKVLYSFCMQGGLNCTDGDRPGGGVVQDVSGNLYGTTGSFGPDNGNTVFQLIPPRAGQIAWTHKVLYRFCGIAPPCINGNGPGGLIRDAAGRLYGTTIEGGADGGGTVFELGPPAAGKKVWTYQVLYSFCARGGTACTDGETPESGVGPGCLGEPLRHDLRGRQVWRWDRVRADPVKRWKLPYSLAPLAGRGLG